MSMKNLAEHIIAVANDNQRSITNLQLQKIMYFIVRNAMEVFQTREEIQQELYDEPFLVWQYGPVIESQYRRFRSYGSNPILEEFDQVEEYSGFNDRIIEYLDMDVFGLVYSSHSHKFWRENESSIKYGISNIKYELEDVLLNGGN